MDPLSLAIGGAAALLGAWRLVSIMRVRINAQMFLTVLVKLIKAGNAARAIKLCSAAPHAIVAGAAKAGLLASGDKGDGIELRRIRVVDAYTREMSNRLDAIGRGALIGWAGGALGVAAIFIGLTAEPTTILAAGLGAAAVANALFSWWSYGSLRRDARVVGDGLIEALLAEWMDDDDRDDDSRDPDRAKKEAEAISETLGLGLPRPEPVAIAPEPVGLEPAPAEVLAAAKAGRRVADMRDGRCALCDNDDIADAADPAREGFRVFTCRACGYSQLFADDPARV